ncbi:MULTISPECIES: NAD(P)/FAD-dependent oxidoreductase [Acinetobacter]|uniref:NAD(P)/FAD-dependent oxidoreductase n=1 Tax=Acinetobacter TaxID=469 RepID=UPI0002AEE039|nr:MULTISPECIES: NAD(P)-binding protein [Acinetobacter]ELW86535.1 NAD(P)-binding Rossmann-like domain protein [Acinetobacter sp. WC-743]MBJ8426999.1 FAD-dependent oxidoreductase [Acinetobacter bereziniae]MBJ8474991.1 FAD-dependent oxidoreductase [Acinetobacter bereziniae]
MKIAIIGSGISGLYAAWKLSKHHQVTIFEKNTYFGGHTDTHDMIIDEQKLAIDSGFIVFNHYNYPLFSQMIAELGVKAQNSDMSFSVNNLITGLQYNPSKKISLLSRPQNFFKSKFRAMLSDLFKFYSANKTVVVNDLEINLSIEDYLNQNGYSEAFRQEHLYPMCGALWSCPIDQVGKIPYKFVVSFFQHHRMLQLKDRPQWQTIIGGSARYVEAIQQQSANIEFKKQAVISVSRLTDQVIVQTEYETQKFDWVVFASHADDSLKLLNDPSELEQEVLSKFSYQDNKMVVHHDLTIMPKSKSQWASWHVHITEDQSNFDTQNIKPRVHYTFSYWMNKLQNLSCQTQIFATLNPNFDIKPELILVEREYRHPVFDVSAIGAQGRWSEINGQNRTSFCGAYWGWGFHEDGVRSAAQVVKHIEKLI